MKPRRREGAGLLADLEAAASRRPRVCSPAIAWRWRYELLLAVGLPLTAVLITRAVGSVFALAGAMITALAVGLWGPSRQRLAALAWCVVTPHRIRAGLVQAGIYSRHGRLPLIVGISPVAYGERVRIWCVAGTCAEDIRSARSILCAACWAADVRVRRDPGHAQLITLEVIRRPPARPASSCVDCPP